MDLQPPGCTIEKRESVPPVPTAILILAGMATVYGAHSPNAPLYCDGRLGPAGTLLFHTVTQPWVALDVSEYTSGRVRCGDDIIVRFPGTIGGHGTHTLRAQALDAGPLYPFVIAETELPIVVDIPRHQAPFTGLSHPATVINVSAVRRHAAEVIPQ